MITAALSSSSKEVDCFNGGLEGAGGRFLAVGGDGVALGLGLGTGGESVGEGGEKGGGLGLWKRGWDADTARGRGCGGSSKLTVADLLGLGGGDFCGVGLVTFISGKSVLSLSDATVVSDLVLFLACGLSMVSLVSFVVTGCEGMSVSMSIPTSVTLSVFALDCDTGCFGLRAEIILIPLSCASTGDPRPWGAAFSSTGPSLTCSRRLRSYISTYQEPPYSPSLEAWRAWEEVVC